MLRELIAAVVVKRAIRLAELDKPEDAFRTRYHWKSGNYMCTIWGWDQMLTGFEIIVSSSNNGAVENISKEIPGRNAIDCEDASYYPGLATTVLNSDNDPAQKSTPGAWSRPASAGNPTGTSLPTHSGLATKRRESRASRTLLRGMSRLRSPTGRPPCRPSAPHSAMNNTFAQNELWCIRS